MQRNLIGSIRPFTGGARCQIADGRKRSSPPPKQGRGYCASGQHEHDEELGWRCAGRSSPCFRGTLLAQNSQMWPRSQAPDCFTSRVLSDELTHRKRQPATGVCLPSNVSLDSHRRASRTGGMVRSTMSFRARRELLVQVAPRYKAARHGRGDAETTVGVPPRHGRQCEHVRRPAPSRARQPGEGVVSPLGPGPVHKLVKAWSQQCIRATCSSSGRWAHGPCAFRWVHRSSQLPLLLWGAVVLSPCRSRIDGRWPERQLQTSRCLERNLK